LPILRQADILNAMGNKFGSKFLRGSLLIFLVGGFSLLLLYVVFSEDPSQKGETGDWRTTDEDLRLEGIHFKEWKQGELVWVLDARQGKYYHEKEKGFFEDVALAFRPPSGEKMTVYADQVMYELGQRELSAEGNVWGESVDGYRFYTNSITFDVESREVASPDKVTLKKDRLAIEGVGMKGSLLGQTFVLLSSVKTVFSPERGSQ